MTVASLVALAVVFATTAGQPQHAAARPVEKPAFRHRFIPLTRRRRETTAYAERHYGCSAGRSPGRT